jgi:hypothetical protein
MKINRIGVCPVCKSKLKRQERIENRIYCFCFSCGTRHVLEFTLYTLYPVAEK